MNTQPNQQLRTVEIAPLTYLRERQFWQSRSNLRDPPNLVSIYSLAKEIRRGRVS